MSKQQRLLSVLKKKSIDIASIKENLLREKRIILICGPTGIGKTGLAIELASLLGTDIISADSMQVYRGMDIGTDKIDMSPYGIRQFMIDLFEPDYKLTVKEFRDIAVGILEDDFLKAKKIPIIAGGSGMYIKTIIDGIDESPGEDAQLRKKIEKDMDRSGLDKYYEKLKKVDSEYAARISKNDRRRILRALEVYLTSGRPYSEFQRSWEDDTVYKVSFIGLKKERSALYDDIEKRVDDMFEKGFVLEVEDLLSKGYGNSISMAQAVGYKEVVNFLRGGISLEECRRQMKQNSRRLAKKQMTWFRQDDRINWLSMDNYDNIFDLIIDALKLIDKD